MAEVQWIRFIVGMFDGNSFKRIKRAKIGGVSYRDKLTAVWFELLDLAGKSNANGYLIDNNEIPYRTFDDIATMLDRDEKEIELCMQFFINERMVEIIDDVYCLTNFVKYQNQDGLEKIREQNRLRKQKQREKLRLLSGASRDMSRDMSRDVTEDVTECHAADIDIDIELDKESDIHIINVPETAQAEAAKKDGNADLIAAIVDRLNDKAGTNYKATTKATKAHINARLSEGFTFDDFVVVIDKKVAEWATDTKMAQYLRPETLFGTKFESYLNAPCKTKQPASTYDDGVNLDHIF
ncbi:MAG: replication protein [Ruminococcaceae bacterium]|nr:replication protein [Oscillospiraceae bacterium]